MSDFIDELKWRGLFSQATDEGGLRAHLAGGVRRAYVGFDPTADSLTIGNLVPLMLLVHFQRAGHAPVVVVGGGTGLIGDPSGKSAERQLQTREVVDANVRGQMRVYERFLDFSPETCNRATITNNADWLCKLGFIEALRDIGKFFSVNAMIQKDSVRERLTNRDQGISFTEFSYQVLQSYDFLYLFEERGVTVQMGGSDQWGNITAGCDLIRKSRALKGGGEPAEHTFGLTAPLLLKADGGKFGKSEAGAVWATADRTSPFAYYQFWLNSDDADVVKFLKIFTLLSREEIGALESAHAREPGQREAHRTLAREATTLLHGAAEAANAEGAAKALFSGEVAGLTEAVLNEVFANVPASEHPKEQLQGAGVALADLLTTTKLAQSKREAKEFLSAGSVMVNGRRAGAEDRLTGSDLLHASMIALRRGKKNWHLTRWK